MAQSKLPIVCIEEPFAWEAGVICLIQDDERKRFATKKYCSLCGRKEPLTHTHLSGDVKTPICVGCAEKYPLQAEAFMRRMGLWERK
jgi:hypothetical protein